ncbi:MAG: tetratricopeptide repeat protein [Chrysiogenales bacterium]|nr:MAG: tetratricopeptide repeat protein [Chrysiogenales bacterium]
MTQARTYARLCILFFLVYAPAAAEVEEFYRLQHLLGLAGKPPEIAMPKDHIYFKNDIAYCTGESGLAVANNRAAEMMESGNYEGATRLLNAALKNAALFFPFRYNLGTCYFHLNRLNRSLLHFRKALAVVPEYAGTYLRIGAIHQLRYRDNEAIESYRQALRVNRNELNTYVLIGDLFFERDQVQLAKKYYDTCLRIDHRFNNALLGRSKIHFKEGEYYKAMVSLKMVDTRKEFDVAYHYYYAESAFKLRDYAAASKNYEILLRHRANKFFLTHSVSLIERKLYLSNRFVDK